MLSPREVTWHQIFFLTDERTSLKGRQVELMRPIVGCRIVLQLSKGRGPRS